jgi:hypothetical protein
MELPTGPAPASTAENAVLTETRRVTVEHLGTIIAVEKGVDETLITKRVVINGVSPTSTSGAQVVVIQNVHLPLLRTALERIMK